MSQNCIWVIPGGEGMEKKNLN